MKQPTNGNPTLEKAIDFLTQTLKKYFNAMPDKENEEDTIKNISAGVSFHGATLWVLVFAIFIASLGLNVNSTAVIIGAMLISPLMGPIIGMGLAVGINDFDLLKRSAKNYLVATVISVITATVYFLLTPLDQAQSELLARTSPTLYDVLIALFGGAAGIVALATKGKGNVLRQMFRDIEADCYLVVDGDDTYPADAAMALCEPILYQSADMVVGDRLSNGTYAAENSRAMHGFGNNLVRAMIRWIYGYSFKDVMTGYRALSRTFVKTLPVLSEGFQIETEISIHAVDRRWRILEVPIVYRDRPEGSESKLSTVSDGVKVIIAISSLFKNSPRSFNNFKAFHCFGLCDAVRMIPPSAPSMVTASSVVGVVARSMSTTSQPIPIRVPTTTFFTISPEIRASRPTTILLLFTVEVLRIKVA